MGAENSRQSINEIAQSIAVIVACGFVVSILFDWGFCIALGLDFSEIPTTITDHFRTGLLWFPVILGGAFFYFASDYHFKRVERGLTEEEIVSNSRRPKTTKAFRDSPFILLKISAPIAIAIYLALGDMFTILLPVAFAIAWMTFAGWCYSAPLIQIRRSWETQVLFTFLPAVGLFAFFSGYDHAVSSAYRQPTEVSIQLLGESDSQKGKLLRTLENGLMVLSSEHHIQYFPWAQIKTYVTTSSHEPFQGLLCNWHDLCAPLRGSEQSDSIE